MNERFARQLACIGQEKQDKISSASIIIAGLGGIGSVSSIMLAKMGVGTLTLIDKDIVEIHNTSRQMYTDTDVSKPKSEVAANKIKRINPNVKVNTVYGTLSSSQYKVLIDTTKADMVLDCTDNLEARYDIEDACVAKNIPWIHASVLAYSGRVKTFMPHFKSRLTEFYPNKFDFNSIDPKIIGTILPTVELVGTTQVTEALKILWGEPMTTDDGHEYIYHISISPVTTISILPLI